MTCRHAKGDPNCSSHPNNQLYLQESRELIGRMNAPTPDASNYEILDVQQVGKHLVLKVKYPNCAKCSYEGVKIMAWLNMPVTDALRWRTIDPHFRPLDPKMQRTQAPSPDVRFPGTEQGWADAISWCRSKL